MTDPNCFIQAKSYEGSAISTFSDYSSASQCQSACQQNLACAVFVYDSASKVCYSKALSAIAPFTASANMIIGPPICTIYQGKSIENNIIFKIKKRKIAYYFLTQTSWTIRNLENVNKNTLWLIPFDKGIN
jgi:hypothetical protein